MTTDEMAGLLFGIYAYSPRMYIPGDQERIQSTLSLLFKRRELIRPTSIKEDVRVKELFTKKYNPFSNHDDKYWKIVFVAALSVYSCHSVIGIDQEQIAKRR